MARLMVFFFYSDVDVGIGLSPGKVAQFDGEFSFLLWTDLFNGLRFGSVEMRFYLLFNEEKWRRTVDPEIVQCSFIIFFGPEVMCMVMVIFVLHIAIEKDKREFK